MKLKLIAPFIILWLVTGTGLTPAGIDETWHNYTNGNYVNALAVDDQYIWAATAGGVVRWNRIDGSLADNIVYTISVDGAGHKWFGTLNGVSKFDDQKWTTYTSLDGLANDRVYAIAIDAMERKWFGTQNGVTVFGRFYLTPSNSP
jgi:ligand-binding sensor domain-containing protein